MCMCIHYLMWDQNNSMEQGEDESSTNLLNLWRFIRPDWVILLTGVVLYGIIGATYPIIAALIANVNAVSYWVY